MQQGLESTAQLWGVCSNPTLPHSGWVNLGRYLSPSEPQSPPLKSGANKWDNVGKELSTEANSR